MYISFLFGHKLLLSSVSDNRAPVKFHASFFFILLFFKDYQNHKSDSTNYILTRTNKLGF